MKNAKKIYDSIIVPDRLTQVIESTTKKRVKRTYFQPLLTIAVTTCLLLIVILPNMNSVMAKGIYQIPVIGDLARIFTFRDYHKQDEYSVIDVRMPKINNTGNSLLEKKVNEEILLRISDIINEVEIKARKYKQAYLETGGIESEFQPIILQIDYTIQSLTNERLSFVITSTESFSSSYTQQFFYNIDLKTGKEITLSEMLGSNYKEIINRSIYQQIEERMQQDNMIYFDGSDGIPGFTGIHDQQDFYINADGKVVIVFAKYEIAPGYMGIQEFVID